MTYKLHTEDTAPEGSKEVLGQVKQKYGFIPNAFGVMAEAPAVVKSYVALAQFLGETSLTETERQIVLLTTSFANGCDYCMAAHSTVAQMQKVPSDIIDALRNNTPIGDKKLEALRRFTFEVTEKRGYPSETVLRDFLASGYTQTQILEVVLGVSFKTLSNYTNHLAKTPLDEAFKKAEWQKPAKAA